MVVVVVFVVVVVVLFAARRARRDAASAVIASLFLLRPVSMDRLRALVILLGVVWIAAGLLPLVPEPAFVNDAALVFFDPAWILRHERRLSWAHLWIAVNTMQRVGLVLCLVAGPGHRLLERWSARRPVVAACAIVVVLALGRVLTGPSAAFLVRLGVDVVEPSATPDVLAALQYRSRSSMALFLRSVLDGAVTLSLLSRWPRAGLVAWFVWTSFHTVLLDNLLAAISPPRAVAAPPPEIVQLVSRYGLSKDDVRVIAGQEQPFTHNIGAAREIVLSKGWLATTPPDEQASVVAHEIGHLLARDGEEDALVGVARCAILALVQAASLWFVRRRVLLSVAASWPLLFLVVSATKVILVPVEHAIDHRQELRADLVSIDAVGFETFVTAHVRLTRDFRNDPALSWAAALWVEHPDFITRIRQAEERTGRRVTPEVATCQDRRVLDLLLQ
jgi:Zn-dependent protease with chaperone function